MSHLDAETLWSLVRTELAADEQQAVKRHLEGCPDCRVALEDVQLAQGLLMDLPPVPAMPEAMARRVGQQLAEAADAQAARSFTSWWQSLFSPRFMLASALAVAVVIAGAYLLATPGEAPTPVATPTPQPVTAPAQPKLSVTVASAKRATASRKQVLKEGATISTQTGGSLWMQLPDGSRAGLTSASEVKLQTLEAKTLTLDILKGSLALVVPHREDRVLTVRAGDLEVRDLGTRFLVSREPSHTVVAVEEGVVEVKTPGGTRQVRAGHAVTWRQGQLSEMAWEQTPVPAVQPVAVAAPTEPQTPEIPPDSVARLEEEDDDSAPPEESQLPPAQAPDQTPVAADEQWAALPAQQRLPPVSAFAPPPRGTVVTSSARTFSLRNIERKLREIGATITTPSGREARARNIALSADANDCEHTLLLSQQWLLEPVTGAANEPQLRRMVQLSRVRCLNHLGRSEDAQTLQRAIDAAP